MNTTTVIKMFLLYYAIKCMYIYMQEKRGKEVDMIKRSLK